MPETIAIDRLSYGPDGVGRLPDGKVAFVPNVAPGDVVEARVVHDEQRRCQMALERVVEPSPQRVTPNCPASLQCGGCPWMQVGYEAQLRAKRDNVVFQLGRALGMAQDAAEALVAPCVPSKRELGFRNKLEFAARTNDKGLFRLGLHERGSDELVCPKRCLAGARGIEKAPDALRGALSYLSRSQDLGIYRVGVRHSLRTKDTEIALWTAPGAFPRKMVSSVLGTALKATSVVRVMADPGKARKVKGVEALSGKGFWEEQLAGFRFLVSAPSFFQVNTAQAENMVELVLGFLDPGPDSVVADLYCGVGTFTLPLAATGAYTFGIESAGSSVRDLRRNAQKANLHVEVIGGDATRELPELGELDGLMVDPPRAGLSKEIVGSIKRCRTPKLAYVSCDPATWARDVARLQDSGYRLVKATPVDLFPQTYHVETVSFFERR